MQKSPDLRASLLTVLSILALASACSKQDSPAAMSDAPSTGSAGSAGDPAADAPAAGVGMPDAGGRSPTAADAEPAADNVPDTPSQDAADGGEKDAAPPLTDAGARADAEATPRSTGPGDWGPGDYPSGLMEQTYLEISGVAGQNGPRQYKVHVPPSYDPQVPMPAVFCIHGLGQDALLFCVTSAGWHDLADREGFILIMPNGHENSWNGGTCCGGASSSQLDDVALMRAIFDEVGTHLNIDLDRVYATGLSNGGYLSYRLACEAADVFAAVAPGAAAVGINDIGGGTNPRSDFTACEPTRPVAVLDIHGTSDPLIPYSVQAPSLARMAEAAGCDEAMQPASAPPSAGDTECVSYTGCRDDVEITGCTVRGGGHCWFGNEDCGTGGGAIGVAIVGANSDTMDNNAAIVDFFRRNAR